MAYRHCVVVLESHANQVMTFSEELSQAVSDIVTGRWSTTDGKTVPETEEIGLGNKGVELEATMLYADLVDSTEMAMHDRKIAAEVYKAFLHCSSKIILRNGYVRSFDGDRVMGVFIGDSKNTSAAKAALNINWAFRELITPQFKKQYEVFRNETLKLAHCTGVDTSKVLVARAGVRANNDLVWVGRAPNIAAKLSTLRDPPYYSWITNDVYKNMNAEAKVSNGKEMWENRNWNTLPEGMRSVYRSSWTWKP